MAWSCEWSGIRTWTSEPSARLRYVTTKLEVFSDSTAVRGFAGTGRFGANATCANLVSVGAGMNQRCTRQYHATQGRSQPSGSVHEGGEMEVELQLLERAGSRAYSPDAPLPISRGAP